ncbi:DegV family protein [Chloroflexota bacterium]
MSKIAIVTDSVACISEELQKKHDIRVAPVQIIWDRVEYRDGIDLTTTEFYKRLRTSKTLPTTSSGIPGEFTRIFEDLKKEKVDGVVAIVLSGVLGASYKSALAARDSMSDAPPMEIIDTNTAMMAQGFAVLAAARAAEAGGSMEDIAKAARDTVAMTHIFWAMDTLEYLKKGGRVSLPQAVIASWLQVKPITGINIENGKVEPLARVRTRGKVISKLIEMMDERVKDTGPLHVAVMHGDSSVEAEKLEKIVAEKYSPVEIMLSEITPVIGTHTGPGTLGLAFYNE